nr:D-tyrosyl-tRNA(Tyr) deacylase [Polyrhizophydium stewartii]
MWTRSVKDISGEILSEAVSQFTLFAKTAKGNKPDFHLAMKSASSKEFYDQFLAKLQAAYEPTKIKDGVFGAMMVVDIANDGPVTIIIDTEDK